MERCLSCSRAGPDIGTCGSFMTCPKQARPVDPKTEVTIRCDACDITRAVSVETLLRAKEPRVDHICPQGDCKAFIVRPEPATALYDNNVPLGTYALGDPLPPLPASPKAPRKKG